MPNRLARETSPYLQQHADNPVDWYPWGEEALRRAREQDKPILLSIGYSACHWCHVMAHESFEDPEVAGVMNALFVNVKVDREERPDIDQIYQTALHLLTQRAGGWPLTMFLTPDGKPFFGGTYFPKAARYNLPGFTGLLERVAEAYRTQRSEIDQQNGELLRILAGTVPPVPQDGTELDARPITGARSELKRAFDPEHGGLGSAPKFPHPFEFDFLLRESVLRDDADARHAVLHTLTKMAKGGVYDQLGGGFCRYSVDGEWQIPHFEKMLYDNGPLLRLFVDAWLLTRDPLYRRVCEETAAWVMREMQSPAGGYYSSLDADAEGEEGKFHVWDRDEVASLLTDDEYRLAAACYGLDGSPDFERRHWHLRLARDLDQVALSVGRPVADCAALLESARAKLFAARERRVHPGRDDKILTSWNALMIEGMARGARVFDRSDWLASARSALDFVRTSLWREGRLLATHKDGISHLNAYLDDHAFLLGALLEVMQAEFRRQDLDWAIAIADVLLEHFEDRDAGGFWFTSHDHEQLILRTKPGHDNATPAGNGMAALHLQRLGHLIGEARYLNAAERTLRLFHATAVRQPSGFATYCRALGEFLEPPVVVVLRGPTTALAAWSRDLAASYAPSTLVLALPATKEPLPAVLDKHVGPTVNAWVCRGVVCLPPMERVAEVLRAIGGEA
jgi:uncharacterized protein YyaL (SSP411 family)